MFQVEISDIADAEIQSAYLRLNGLNPNFAGRWLEGLLRVIESLELFPTIHAVASNTELFGRDVRRKVYRNGQTSYDILFSIIDANDDGEEDTVRVLHVRHGARRPINESDQED